MKGKPGRPRGPVKRRITIYILETAAEVYDKRAAVKGETTPEYIARNLNASVEKS